MKNEEKSLRKIYHVTDTLASNLTLLYYHRTSFHECQLNLFIETLCMPSKNCPHEKTYSGYV